MQIITESIGDEILLKLSGDVDGIGADELAVELSKAEETHAGRIIMDFSEVTMITSLGLGTIIITYKRLESLGRTLELRNLQPNVRKVFLMTGLDRILKVQKSADEVFQKGDHISERAMQNAKEFLGEMMLNLGVETDTGTEVIDRIFHICDKPTPTPDKAVKLRKLLAGLQLPARMADSQKNLASDMHGRIRPYVVGMESLLHVRCGDGKLAGLFKQEFNKIQLLDVVDRNQTDLPFMKHNGVKIPLPDKSFDVSLLHCSLSHCVSPESAISEVLRVTKKRIIVIESICLNETQRQFNIFFDWLFNVVLGQAEELAYNFKKPDDWKWFFRDLGLSIRASVDMGLDHPTVPEYHWMYVLDLPGQ